jgi:hypothetical protein
MDFQPEGTFQRIEVFPMKRKLFVSFSTLLNQMGGGLVGSEDLEGALFLFFCARWHGLAEVTGEHRFESHEAAFSDEGERTEAYRLLYKTFFTAEKEGRIRWAGDIERKEVEWEDVAGFLQQNGYEFDLGRLRGESFWDCRPTTIRRAIAKLDLPIEVIPN